MTLSFPLTFCDGRCGAGPCGEGRQDVQAADGIGQYETCRRMPFPVEDEWFAYAALAMESKRGVEVWPVALFFQDAYNFHVKLILYADKIYTGGQRRQIQ